MPAAEFGAFHRDLFERYYQFAEALLRSRPDLAGARALPEVLAPVQHPRREQQHRRDRADRLHPARPAAGGRHREGVRRRDARQPAAGGGLRRHGSRTAARNRLRGAAGELAAGADASRSARSLAAQLREHRLTPEAPAETYSTPRRLTVRIARARRAPDRPRGARHRAAGVGRLQRRRHADAGRRRVCREAGRRGRRRSSASRRRRASTSRIARSSAARPPSTCCPTCSAATLRGADVPEADALGRACSTTAGASCCSAGRSAGCCSSTAAASCRSRSARTPAAQTAQVQDVTSGRRRPTATAS